MDNEAPLKAGDVVELKSGSPKMTIEEISGESANVVWFSKNCEENRGVYSLSTLRKWKPKPISARVV